MATFILGPYYLKTKGGYTTAQAFCPGFISGVSNFLNGGTSGYATTGQNQTFQNIMESSTVPATITTSNMADSGAVSYLIGGPTGATRLRVYKGAKPSMSSLTNLNNHNSDLLIDFVIPRYYQSGGGGFRFLDISPTSSIKISSSQNNYGNGFSIIAGICPQGAEASQSGQATWFWFGNYNSPSNLTDVCFVTGDVSSNGSSGDLVMMDTNVTAGEKYYSSGFKLDIPAFYTV
jgi:hypothetical protein